MADTMTGSKVVPASYDTLQKIAAVNVRTLSRLASLQIELATLSLETGVAHVKLFSQPDGYEQFYSGKSVLASLYGNRVVEISRQTTDILLRSGDELNSLLGGVFTAARVSMVNKTAEVAARPAVKKPARTKPVKKSAGKTSRK